MLKFIFLVFAVWLVGMFLVNYLEELADEYDAKPSKAETVKPVVDYKYDTKGWYF